MNKPVGDIDGRTNKYAARQSFGPKALRNNFVDKHATTDPVALRLGALLGAEQESFCGCQQASCQEGENKPILSRIPDKVLFGGIPC